MSVLIKGMKMPSSCLECPCILNLFYCRACGGMAITDSSSTTFDNNSITIRRPDWCPLVALPEHYGRLIDADFLEEHLYTCATNGRPLHRMYQELDELLEAINDIPTVVEAE